MTNQRLRLSINLNPLKFRIQFASVTDKLTLFYGISNLQVNLLSIIYFCVYVSKLLCSRLSKDRSFQTQTLSSPR